MNSFYGGQPGFSFIISKSYPSVAAMIEDFKLGPEFDAVHFNEYVLINTEDKNSDENGRIYRRGMEYNNDMGGAQYVGTIVGPAGPAPMLELTTIEKVQEEKKKVGPDQYYRFTEGEYTVPTSLVPGKVDGEEQYNDTIKWACCSVRDENGTDTTAYIGFRVPYLVIDFTAQSVDPYYQRDDEAEHQSAFNNLNLIKRIDELEHPFFEKWHVSVPKGIKGDTFKNFRVVPATDIVEYGDKEENKADDTAESREILVYDYYHYDKESEGEFTTLYLGDYNVIKDILLDEEGTLTVQYHHDDDDTWEKIFKWIDEVTLDTNTGLFTVTYNHERDAEGNETKYETYLDWVQDILFNDDGTITLQYSHTEDHVSDTKIKWITDVTLDAEGTLTIQYNDGTEKKFEKVIKWISNVTLDDEGNLSIEYNNGEEAFTAVLKYLSDIVIQTENAEAGGEGTGDQKVHVTFNTGDEKAIGEPLNYIMQMATTDDFHLIAKHADPAKRQAIIEAGQNYKGPDQSGYDNDLEWQDLGSIKDEDGILIGLNLTEEELGESINSIQDTIEYLKQGYPDGLSGDNLTGKVVSVGSEENGKLLYAFDYSLLNGQYKGWYYLGALQLDIGHIITVAEDGEEEKLTKLEPDGVWFKIEQNIIVEV